MTKTEQLILDRIKAKNDLGEAAYKWQVVGKTKGTYDRRCRCRVNQKPKANEVQALESLLASNAFVNIQGAYYVHGHSLLAEVAKQFKEEQAWHVREMQEMKTRLAQLEERHAWRLAFIREQLGDDVS